ncbi:MULTISPECIES: hypothetical protein [unclassified Acinetobacter]|uniref:hypothetical protein n=1 Tax=unclassified Acinetobacter TaxID=196816 RepID=UPI0035B6CF09
MVNQSSTSNLYVMLTPAGVLEAFSSAEPTEMQLALQAVISERTSMSVELWVRQFSTQSLEHAMHQHWIECIESYSSAPDLPLDDFLPHVVSSLSGQRKAAIASAEGFCLAHIGYSQEDAEMLCVAAGDFASFLQRQQQRGWHTTAKAISFFEQVDLVMPSTSLVLLWIDGQGYILILDSEPLINSRAFVELIWAIKTSGLRFQV